ncbi:TPA: AIPR family protein [Vibrio parahaemolyticus]|nr:AIPR family protein [Vibrio parahaemolyticus]HCE2906930.1 AIPR family protein [Vibrio parahaemolyticus]HCE4638724.1 AIPR family protein [Vibrio parahaemolyticus]HCH0318841.1 AIPR family protein [Vibrio parahaemolyticus]HCH2609563.1 AIPR family protein [Vibrio parahaemolyticus]
MRNEDFYKILDDKLSSIVSEQLSSESYKNLKEDHQKKSYALLIWFLKTYSNIADVNEYITDGNDDHSCDIILDRTSSSGEKVFYIVQSKWNNESGCNGKIESEVIKSYLSDVHSIIKGDKKKGTNDKFNARYDDLREHIRKNGAIRVIYLTLKNKSESSEDNQRTFESTIGGDIKVEAFDINRLKSDYIDREFKKSYAPDPLNKIYNPELKKIIIKKVVDSDNSHLSISYPYEAHVVNVRPSLIHDWVSHYGVSLFDKNVRNPMKGSSINSGIKDTLINNPSSFWYFNNGITAITKSMPRVNSEAEEFEVTGLQVINGAQTAYSVYSAYEDASPEERNIIDNEAKITLRLLKSGGRDFDLQVTRYTNSQNPVTERDFWSNDPIQEEIQRYFYNTSYWYEKRNGEFRTVPEGIEVVSNEKAAQAYLSFWLGDPIAMIGYNKEKDRKGVDLLFTSFRDNRDGLYETVFNSKTNPQDMLSSYFMLKLYREFNGAISIYHSLAWSKIILSKYLADKFGTNDVNISKYIIDNIEKNRDLFEKIYRFTGEFLELQVTDDSGFDFEKLINVVQKNSHFEICTEVLKKMEITCDRVDIISLEDKDNDDLDIDPSE